MTNPFRSLPLAALASLPFAALASLRLAALAAAAALLIAAPAGAEEEAWSGEMVDELMSPYCPGRTLRSCPSPQAGELIVWIEEQEARGRDREGVYDQLLAEFGDEIRQAPTADGFGAAAYVVPVLAFVAGGAVVAVFLRRQGTGRDGPSRPSAVPPATADPELERRVDEELRRTS